MRMDTRMVEFLDGHVMRFALCHCFSSVSSNVISRPNRISLSIQWESTRIAPPNLFEGRKESPKAECKGIHSANAFHVCDFSVVLNKKVNSKSFLWIYLMISSGLYELLQKKKKKKSL